MHTGIPARLISVLDQLVLQPARGVLRDRQGASAIEFALLAPVLVLGLLGTVDLGRAITDQMSMGSLLRTAAQAAAAGADRATVERVLQAANGDAAVRTSITDPRCSCPENPAVTRSCSTTCANSASTTISYSMSARKQFNGILLPPIALSKELQVQVR